MERKHIFFFFFFFCSFPAFILCFLISKRFLLFSLSDPTRFNFDFRVFISSVCLLSSHSCSFLLSFFFFFKAKGDFIFYCLSELRMRMLMMIFTHGTALDSVGTVFAGTDLSCESLLVCGCVFTVTHTHTHTHTHSSSSSPFHCRSRWSGPGGADRSGLLLCHVVFCIPLVCNISRLAVVVFFLYTSEPQCMLGMCSSLCPARLQSAFQDFWEIVAEWFDHWLIRLEWKVGGKCEYSKEMWCFFGFFSWFKPDSNFAGVVHSSARTKTYLKVICWC